MVTLRNCRCLRRIWVFFVPRGNAQVEYDGVSKVPDELLEELNTKIEHSELASEWATSTSTTPSVAAIRSYDTWERYLWNTHKYGFEYLAYNAPKISANLAALVQHLRVHPSADNTVELYTGYLREYEVAGTNAAVKVPKYVWLVATRTNDDGKKEATVFIVPNGEYDVDEKICSKRCKQIYCCTIGDFIGSVDVLLKIFVDDYELFLFCIK